MRRAMICVALSVVMMLIAAPSAAAIVRDYRGQLEVRGRVDLTFVRKADDPTFRLRHLSVNTRNRVWVCDDPDVDPTDAVAEWFRRADAVYVADDGSFVAHRDYDLYGVRLAGEIGPRSGAGTFRMDFHDGTGCTTGRVGWEVTRLATP